MNDEAFLRWFLFVVIALFMPSVTSQCGNECITLHRDVNNTKSITAAGATTERDVGQVLKKIIATTQAREWQIVMMMNAGGDGTKSKTSERYKSRRHRLKLVSL